VSGADYKLGVFYSDGRSGAPDPKAAARHWAILEADALRGSTQAQYYVGCMREKGYHGAKDVDAAARLYNFAAGHGFGEAQRRLGEMYRDGSGVPKNLQKADYWLYRAAVWGDSKAQAAHDQLLPGLASMPLSVINAFRGRSPAEVAKSFP
jgi:uncharacterized protein